MKLPIIILAVLGLVCGKPLPTGSLQDDVKEFVELFPTNKILEIALDYLANDREVQQFVAYIQSEEFPKIHTAVEHLKEYKDCFKFINDQGVDVYAIINEIHDILGLPPFQPTNTTRMGVGIRGLINDVAAVLPIDEWAALLDKKLETEEFFQNLVTANLSSAFVNMVNTVQAWPEYHEVHEILREMVVNVKQITKILWELSLRETRSLQDDLHDFMALVPTNKVFEVFNIALGYLSNNKELQEFVVYIQSEEFPKIHKIVEYLKEYKDCFKFINDQGVDMYEIINEIRDILDLPPFQPTNTTRGIQGLIDDVVAVLPLDELKALYDKKMETRKYLKTLKTLVTALQSALQSPLFENMVNTVRARPEYKEVREILLEIVREKAVDVDRITRLFRELYWRGTHRVQYELKKFMARVPTDKVLEIAMDYLANDEEVREFVVYIQSEKFPKIHATVEHLKEYENCFNFINDQGVDIYAIINEIHDNLGLPPFQPTNTTRTGVGIYGLIDDEIAVLPVNLTALLGKKMETREIFKTLVTATHSPVFMNMVNTVRAWPEYNEVREILQVMVGDMERIIQLLWELSLRETQSIRDDVKEFMALVPTNKVFEITMDYLANALQEIVAYIQSEQFPKIHKTVEYLKEYKYCLKFINEQGVDVYAFILEIRDILGLPPFEPTNQRMGVSIYGLFDDVVAALPLDDLKALYDKKMETRKYLKTLKTLVTALQSALQSPLFEKMVDTVQALPQYQKLLETLREMGVDVVGIIEHVRALLGQPPV